MTRQRLLRCAVSTVVVWVRGWQMDAVRPRQYLTPKNPVCRLAPKRSLGPLRVSPADRCPPFARATDHLRIQLLVTGGATDTPRFPTFSASRLVGQADFREPRAVADTPGAHVAGKMGRP